MAVHHRRWRFHGLKNPKLRQDWNKHNLYNLARFTRQNTVGRTFFQQKWTAKARTRAYHGEQIREKQWERMFDRRTPAVIPTNARILAEDDGSKFAAGRGSGRDVDPKSQARNPPSTFMPYMQMVYHPTERRLDTAIFRSLFASSARQARQFVTHGHVKVNGKKMIYPGYLLNPGDMFQVEPETVLKCTGKVLKRSPNQVSNPEKSSATETPAEQQAQPQVQTLEAAAEEQEILDQEEADTLTEEELTVAEDDPAAKVKKTLLSLRTQAIELEENPGAGKKLSAKQKQDVRAFRKALKSSISKASSLSPSTLEDLETKWSSLSSRIRSTDPTPTPDSAEGAKNAVSKPTAPTQPQPTTPAIGRRKQDQQDDTTSPEERELTLAQQFWKPKVYMSAFAFIPRYLEVNHSICSAVYLRHPVVKPNLAEVPTPFPPETGQLTFNWYLRRR